MNTLFMPAPASNTKGSFKKIFIKKSENGIIHLSKRVTYLTELKRKEYERLYKVSSCQE